MELIICALSVILFLFILFIEYHRKFNIIRIRKSIIEAGNYLCIFLSLLIAYMAISRIKEFGQLITLSLVYLENLVNDYTYFPIIFSMVIFLLMVVVVYIILRIILAIIIKVILNPILRSINSSQARKPEKARRVVGVFLSIPRALFYMCLFIIILNVAMSNLSL